MSANWDTGLNVAGLVLGILGFAASVASYRQSAQAAVEARSAQERADAAARSSEETIDVVRKGVVQSSILNQLAEVHSLSAELDLSMRAEAYSAVLVRSKDVGRKLAYIISRWNDDIPPPSLVNLVNANAQIEQLTERLQGVSSLSKQEHARLTRIVSRVVRSVSDEHANGEKRREQNA